MLHALLLRPTIVMPLALMALAFTAQAQRVTDGNANLWFSHWGDHRVHDRWSLHSEFHIRRTELGASAQQLLLRPGVNYHLHDKVMATVGYSYYENYRYGAYPIRFANWEHHGFAQLQFSSQVGKLRMQHRYRWEHRWMARMATDEAGTEGTLAGYSESDRFRYRVWVTIPIGQDTPWTVNAYDEIFLSIGGTAPGNRFSQNRVSGLLGYQVNKEFNLLAGYLLQKIDRPSAAFNADVLETNSTLHIVAVYNLGMRRRNAPVVPVPPSDPPL